MRARQATRVAHALEPRGVLRASALAALLLIISCGRNHPTTPAPVVAPPPPPKVLVISVDGLRPDALQRVGATHILGLADRGTYTWQAQTIFPSTTLPSHSSMLSGYEPDSHGIDFNDYRASYTFPVPTVFALAKQAGLSTAMVVGKPKFEQLRAAGGVDSFSIPAGGDAAIADQAAAQVAGFDLTFVHFPDTDLTGHARGWLSGPYLDQVKRTDEAVGRLLQAAPPHTTIILTADHGGHGNNHGSRDPVDTTIPWIVAGPRVARRGPLGCAVRTTDTAATALHVLGLSLRGDAAGTVVSDAFY